MLRRFTKFDIRSPLSPGSRRGLWALAMIDMMAVPWMLTVGEWFDNTSRVTSVITLGGHHVLVLWLAAIGFAILVAIAPTTGGFAEVNRLQTTIMAVAGAISVVALAGVLSVVALVIGVVLLVALLGRAFIR